MEQIGIERVVPSGETRVAASTSAVLEYCPISTKSSRPKVVQVEFN